MLGSIVSSNQNAFVSTRKIVDDVLLVNEVLDMAKREKRSCVLLKVDVEKAYDYVSWNFLRFVFHKMGFGERWIRWMEGSVFSSSVSFIINGSTTKDFKVERVLLQGDPLSPFLCVLVMEALTTLVKKIVEMGDFKGFKYNEEEEVNLLQFAGDTILIMGGSCENLWSIKAILRGFEMMTSLKINFHKSKIYGLKVGD